MCWVPAAAGPLPITRVTAIGSRSCQRPIGTQGVSLESAGALFAAFVGFFPGIAVDGGNRLALGSRETQGSVLHSIVPWRLPSVESRGIAPALHMTNSSPLTIAWKRFRGNPAVHASVARHVSFTRKDFAMKKVFLRLSALLLGLALAGGCRQSPPPYAQPQPFQGYDRPAVQHHPQPPGGGVTQPGETRVAPQPTPGLESQAPPSPQAVPSPQAGDHFSSPAPDAPLTD